MAQPRLTVVASATILLVLGAAGGVGVRQDITTVPGALTPPVTLSAGAFGVTNLGASTTSADTTVSASASLRDVLHLDHATGTWDVRLQHVSNSGFGLLDGIDVMLYDGVTNTQQIDIALGVLVQITGSTVLLDAAQGDLQIRASGTDLNLADNVLGLEIIMVPSGETAPELRYSYQLTMT